MRRGLKLQTGSKLGQASTLRRARLPDEKGTEIIVQVRSLIQLKPAARGSPMRRGLKSALSSAGSRPLSGRARLPDEKGTEILKQSLSGDLDGLPRAAPR